LTKARERWLISATPGHVAVRRHEIGRGPKALPDAETLEPQRGDGDLVTRLLAESTDERRK